MIRNVASTINCQAGGVLDTCDKVNSRLWAVEGGRDPYDSARMSKIAASGFCSDQIARIQKSNIGPGAALRRKRQYDLGRGRGIRRK